MTYLMQILLLLTLWLGQASGGNPPAATLTVQLITPENQPAANVDAHLALYVFEQRGETRMVAKVWYEADCTSDAEGLCVFPIAERPPDGGIYRGAVQIGDQARDVLWPGGDLFLPLRLDKMDAGREGAPFEFDPKGGVPIERVSRWVPALAGGALILGLAIWLAYRSKTA